MRCSCVTFVLVLTILFSASAKPQSVADSRISDELIEKFLPPKSSISELKDIQDALSQGRFDTALKLAEGNIALGPNKFGSKFYGYHVVSASQYYAARASIQLGMDSQGISFYVDSINNGNSGSADEFAELLFRNKIIKLVAAIDMQPSKMLDVLRKSANLGSEVAAAFIAFGDLQLPISKEEWAYWALMSIAGDKVATKEQKRETLTNMISRIGAQRAEEIFGGYSLTGGVIATSELGLPPRGLLESLFIENDLLGSVGVARPGRHDPNETIPQAPTIREAFELFNSLFAEIGFGKPYILLPGTGANEDSDIIMADSTEIVAHVRPGDRLYSTCGALSHVSIVYRVDDAAQAVEFIDPAYQYWMPSHNQCVKSATLKEIELGKFVTVVPKSELPEILVAVMTFRSRR